MSRHERGRGVALALSTVLLVLALGCGDDTAPSVRSNPRDSGDDEAGLDADTPVPDAMIIDGNVAPGDGDGDGDGDMPDATLDDDGGAPTCRQDCAALETECLNAICNGRTLECETFPKADGLACGSQELSTCSAPDTCEAGVCQPHHEDEDVPCGDQGVVCHLDDACDGEGQCADSGLRDVGTACGDSTNSECDAPDACNAAGECAPNYAEAEEPCGDQDEMCRFDDACDGNGACVDRGLWEPGQCPAGSAIGPDGRCGCGRPSGGSSCMPGPDVCVDDECVPGHEHYASLVQAGLTTTDGRACGSPNNTPCDNPDSCLQGVCAGNAEPALTSCGDPTSTVCSGADSCDGFGNCSQRHAAGTTVCGTAPGECFQAPRCNGSGSCLTASALPPNTPCGSQTAAACNGADTCNGFGTCSPNLTADGTACNGPPSGPCDVQDECNGAGQCQALLATPGTVCGDADLECANADTCNAAGACVDNGNATAGEPCGSSGSGECDLADSCDGNGACATNHVAAGESCGDAPFDCMTPNSCDGSGACAQGDFIEDCTVEAGWLIEDENTNEPLAGVTVEVLGSDPLESGVTDSNGVVVLSAPVGRLFRLRTHATATHWGRVSLEAVEPGQSDLLSISLLDDDAIDLMFSASGLAAIGPATGILETVFYGHSQAGGEASILTPTCASGTCGPVTQSSLQVNTVSPTLLAGGSAQLSFVNLTPRSYDIQMNGISGVTQCVSYDEDLPIPVIARTVSSVWVDCNAL